MILIVEILIKVQNGLREEVLGVRMAPIPPSTVSVPIDALTILTLDMP
jgi:hypothetical protein